MKDSVRIFEGAAGSGIDSEATVTYLPVSAPSEGLSGAPHPVYSLDGLMALALAVSRLEVSE
jgi:hypothetical protein